MGMNIDKFILEKLNWRYATKLFNPRKKVAPHALNTLLESAILSPTSLGLQAYKILVSDKDAIKKKLYNPTFHQPQIQTCSHNIILCAKTNVNSDYVDSYITHMANERGIETKELYAFREMCMRYLTSMPPEKKDEWIKYQVYIVLGNIINTCALLGIDCCPIEGFNHKAVDDTLNLEALNLSSVVMCPIGFRDENDLSQKRKKVRFNQQETIIKM